MTLRIRIRFRNSKIATWHEYGSLKQGRPLRHRGEQEEGGQSSPCPLSHQGHGVRVPSKLRDILLNRDRDTIFIANWELNGWKEYQTECIKQCVIIFLLMLHPIWDRSSGPKALHPLERSGHRFFLELQKTVFFLVAKPLPAPPPLSSRATTKKIVFAASLLTCNQWRAASMSSSP